MDKKSIKEIIVVEGRDDTAAIRAAVDAVTIETHGFGIRPQTWDVIAKAYETVGIIVFTDPDHAGEQIRRRVLEKFPNAKEAFLDRELATKDGDIGIENAAPQSIIDALEKAHCIQGDGVADPIGPLDMDRWGLTGRDDSKARRIALGNELGIGFCNAKTFISRLNKFGITREMVESKLEEL